MCNVRRSTLFASVVDEICEPIKLGRNTPNAYLEKAKDRGAAAIATTISYRKEQLAAIDSLSRIDTEFFLQMQGQAGDQRMMEAVLACFPSDATKETATVEKCCERLEELHKGDLYAFVSKQTQGQVTAVREVAECVKQGLEVPVDWHRASNLMRQVLTRTELFLALNSATGARIYGKDAMKQLMDEFDAKHDKDPPLSFDFLQPMVVFKWLLTGQQRAAVANAVHKASSVLGIHAKKVSNKANDKNEAKGSDQTKKRKMDSLAAAYAMF